MAEDQHKLTETTEVVETQDQPEAEMPREEVQSEAAPEKNESLLEQARDLAEDAIETVSSVAESVRDTLGDAVETVAETVGLRDRDEEDRSPVLTSVDSAADLHPTGQIGFTGEITGRVVRLEDLDALQDEEEDTQQHDMLLGMIEQTLTNVSEQDIVKGRVVRVGEKDIVIDIGFKSDGIVPRNEFGADLAPGDEVEVFLERIEDYQGQLVLSKTKADTLRRWQRIEEAYNNEEVLEGTIIRRIKGGMIVELFSGMEAFLPGSQIDVRPVRDFDAYLDKRMEFRIVKLNPANENIVVSHKALIEKELEAQRKKILATMEPGQVLEGTVKNITDFGVFIDLGGVDGLLHITDLSWGRVSHPSELVSLDQKLNIVVLDYDKDRQRISLGLKQLQSHPWENIADKYHEDDEVEGKVVSITDYGAFVELEKGIEGLVHISEMSWTEHIRHPSQMVSLGQIVTVKILNIDHEGKKISLGMKQLQPDPWNGISDRYPPGTVLRGRVRNITNFGVFVEIEPGIDGLVHISDLSWTKRVRHPSEIVKKGQELDIVILNIDEKERRISLGHKQVETNPWNQFATVYSEGTDTEATVSRIEDKGLIVELPLEVEAFIPSGELKNGQSFQDAYRPGDKLQTRVIRFDANNKEIVLSEVAKQRAEERTKREEEQREKRTTRDREQREIQQFQERTPASGPTTLGELSGLAELRAQMEEAEEAARRKDKSAAVPAEPTTVTQRANADLSGEVGTQNRSESDDEAVASAQAGEATSQRSEEAGDLPGAESSKASLKPVEETAGSETTGVVEAEVEPEQATGAAGEKPVATTESDRSVSEIESFTHPEGVEEAAVTTDDVLDTAQAEEATELGKATARVEGEATEESEDEADKA